MTPLVSASNWTARDIPDLSGTRVVITGANSGLGFETTLGLAAKGATVIMACRSADKAEAAVALLRQRLPQLRADALEFRALDLASLESVRAFAEDLLEADPRVDLLINNAGVMALPYRQTADGFEMQFGTNHLGHFALTGRLLPGLLHAAADGRGVRVVNLASLAHKMGKIHFDDLQWQGRYKKWLAYGQSKLANLLFTFEFQRRLDASKTVQDATGGLLTAAAHPGYANTNLQLAGPRMSQAGLAERLMTIGNRRIAQDAAGGALPSLYAAVGPDVGGGDYFGPAGAFEMKGPPTKVQALPRAKDPEVARRLWEVSVELTKVDYAALA